MNNWMNDMCSLMWILSRFSERHFAVHDETEHFVEVDKRAVQRAHPGGQNRGRSQRGGGYKRSWFRLEPKSPNFHCHSTCNMIHMPIHATFENSSPFDLRRAARLQMTVIRRNCWSSDVHGYRTPRIFTLDGLFFFRFQPISSNKLHFSLILPVSCYDRSPNKLILFKSCPFCFKSRISTVESGIEWSIRMTLDQTQTEFGNKVSSDYLICWESDTFRMICFILIKVPDKVFIQQTSFTFGSKDFLNEMAGWIKNFTRICRWKNMITELIRKRSELTISLEEKCWIQNFKQKFEKVFVASIINFLHCFKTFAVSNVAFTGTIDSIISPS